jgi:hypothetical protein
MRSRDFDAVKNCGFGGWRQARKPSKPSEMPPTLKPRLMEALVIQHDP